ncbi:MAG: hydroxyethylthiazole kinase [Clostridium celatum]|uniref:hydroxyethylthiazole kinase n=1 Tax=Clostridium sp. TaxID=1506 RepID=UPI0025D101D8|nr:hydroxyethylthiazole kinase [uncultured Clostridium sp.]MDU4884652.1 hydroxyethylthiazole kinase [Clostridium celatum]MDU5261109.1 hydroxyethylthiazole kinase [Clostridium celatum]MDU7077831.1 hydroxyethylthiazole kinase [Clostridium celatum]
MRLNEESIKYILDLQKNILPLIYCCANNERLRSLESIVNHYNGRLTYKNSYEYKESDLINTLLIFLDEINSDGVLDIEKALIAMNKREIVLLEANGIDSLINKRNLALSIINRYDINVIKGTKSEIETLIKFQENDEESKINYENDNCKFRNFSKRNNSVIIIKDDKYYITDGYSEFIIKNNSNELYDKDILDNIYIGMIAVSIGVCKNKSEIIQAILIATIAFYIGEKRALNYLVNSKIIDNKDIESYLLNEIYKIDIDTIKSYGDVYYSFKRG